MSQQFEQMDEIFRENLKDFQKEPPAHVLNKIKSTYSTGGVSSATRWFWTGGSILLAALTVFGIFSVLSNQTPTIAFNGQASQVSEENVFTAAITGNEAVINTDMVVNASEKQINCNTNSEPLENKEDVVKKNLGSDPASESRLVEVKANAGQNARTCGLTIRLNAQKSDEATIGYWNSSDDGISFISDKYDNPEQDPNAIAVASKPGKYNLTWTESYQSKEDADQVTIDFYKNSGITLNSHIRAASCRRNDGFIRVEAQGGQGVLTYKWLTGNFSDNQRIVDKVSAGTYQLKVTDATNCEEVFTIVVPDSNIIEANFTSVLKGNASSRTVEFRNYSTLDGVSVKDNSNITCQWTISDNRTLLEFSPVVSFQQNGTYSVSLTVSDEGGCTDTFVYSGLYLSPAEVLIPDVFTPNGDGLNDIFVVGASAVKSFKAVVFNSKGEVVHSWTDPAEGWDGKIDGNDAAGEGTYYCIARAIDEEGNQVEKKKAFSLYRNAR